MNKFLFFACLALVAAQKVKDINIDFLFHMCIYVFSPTNPTSPISQASPTSLTSPNPVRCWRSWQTSPASTSSPATWPSSAPPAQTSGPRWSQPSRSAWPRTRQSPGRSLTSPTSLISQISLTSLPRDVPKLKTSRKCSWKYMTVKINVLFFIFQDYICIP